MPELRFRHVAGVSVLVLAGCAAASSTATPTTSTPASTSTTPDRSRAPATADLAAMVAGLDDVPSGWVSTPHDASTDDAGNRSLAACVGFDIYAHHIADYPGPDVHPADNTRTVQSEVIIKDSFDTVTADVTEAKSTAFTDCLTSAAQASNDVGTGPQVTFDPVTTYTLDGAAVAFRSHLRGGADIGPQGSRYSDTILITKGTAEEWLNTIHDGTPDTPAFQTELINRLNARLPS